MRVSEGKVCGRVWAPTPRYAEVGVYMYLISTWVRKLALHHVCVYEVLAACFCQKSERHTHTHAASCFHHFARRVSALRTMPSEKSTLSHRRTMDLCLSGQCAALWPHTQALAHFQVSSFSGRGSAGRPAGKSSTLSTF